mmetsp:Transcript_4273/g.8176  ORF Transcript_4273/g.8176 Transcript_4273/m.8176 type:complete len:97 (-) Transcript_4273:41-331(-)
MLAAILSSVLELLTEEEAEYDCEATAVDAWKEVRPTSIAGAKADTDPEVASAIAAKILMIDEKRNMITFFILCDISTVRLERYIDLCECLVCLGFD